MAQNETWLNHDMMGAVKVRYLDGNVFSQDNAGNLIGVLLTKGGVDYSGGGSVAANVIRADGETVAVTGALSGNAATVVLPQAAYAVPGVLSIIIKLTVSGEITTIAAVVANVYQSTTDSAVDPGTIIPSIETLIDEIEAAVASIPADYSSLWTSFAPVYSNSATYEIGQYVTYDGGLYRCISTISSGESWTAAHWKKVDIGSDSANTTSSLDFVSGGKFVDGWDYGHIIQTNQSTVDISTRNNQHTMACIVDNCSPGDRYIITGRGASASRLWCFIDSSGNSLSVAASNVTEDGLEIIAPLGSSKIVCNVYLTTPYSLYKGRTLKDLGELESFSNRVDFTSFTEGSDNYYVSNYVYLPAPAGVKIFLVTKYANGDVYYYNSGNTQIRSQTISKQSVTELSIPDNTYRFFVRLAATDGSETSEAYLLDNVYMLYDNALIEKVNNLENFNNVVYFTKYTEGSSNYGVSNFIYPTGENASFYAVLGAVSGSAYYYDVSGTQLGQQSLTTNGKTKLILPEGTRRFMLRLTTGSTFNENTLLKNSYLLVNNKLFDSIEELNRMTDAYLMKDDIKHRVIVDVNGNGDYTSISSAWNAIKDSSYTNQYEICVMPGTYNENNITPPSFTHTHGIVPDSVLITSYGGDTTKSVIDVKAPCKLSNMNIISYTKYCIHYDSSLNTGGLLVCENMKLTQTGTGNGVCAGGGAFPNGTVYLWKSCSFIGGPAHCHTSGQFNDWDNTHDVFENCKADPFYGYLVQSVGGYGHNVFEINGSEFSPGYGRGIRIDANNQRNSDKPWSFLAEPNEWQITGHGNKNTLVTFNGSGEGLMFETASVNKTIEVSGTAVPALFGIVKYRQGGARLKGKAYGIYLVKDAQTPNGTDVYQMWKRLGDCSSTNKTLTVKVGSTTQTYTFNQNYLSSKPSESTIIAAVNAVITAAVLKKNVITEFWTGVNLMEKQNTIVRSDCIAKGYFVGPDGRYCSENAAASAVWGIALEDGVEGETITVWTGDYMVTTLADGQYGVGQYGAPDSSVSNKVISVSSGVITRL